MNNKRTIERIAPIALAASLVGYFVHQRPRRITVCACKAELNRGLELVVVLVKYQALQFSYTQILQAQHTQNDCNNTVDLYTNIIRKYGTSSNYSVYGKLVRPVIGGFIGLIAAPLVTPSLYNRMSVLAFNQTLAMITRAVFTSLSTQRQDL